MKALVGAFNQKKALVGAFSMIVKTGFGTDGSICGTTSKYVNCKHLSTKVLFLNPNFCFFHCLIERSGECKLKLERKVAE